MLPVSFESHPDRYRHFRLTIDGEIATLVLDVREDEPLAGGADDRPRGDVGSRGLGTRCELLHRRTLRRGETIGPARAEELPEEEERRRFRLVRTS